MLKNEKLIYTNENGESIEMSFFSRLICKGFDDSLPVSYNTIKNANQDGETAMSQTFDPRSIGIDCVYQVDSSCEEFERKIKRCLNPRYKGVLKYITTKATKEIDVKIESVPQFKHSGMKGTLMIDFVAHAPFWKAIKQSEYLALLTPNCHFPMSFRGGMVFGVKRSSLVSKIENAGDVDCGYTVTFKATNGSVKNPFIKNVKTGQKIQLNIAMEKDDIVKVNAEGASPIIYYNDVKNIRILNRLESDFFNLSVGQNEIEYNAEENVMNLDVIVSYRPLIL